MFTPVRMNKLFAVIVKDHVGKVISALSETEKCHFIAAAIKNTTTKKTMISSIERRIDEILFKIPLGELIEVEFDVSSDADIMLCSLKMEVEENTDLSMRRAIEIKKNLQYLKSVYAILDECEETPYTYILEAWIPEGYQDIIRAAMNEASNEKCVLYISEPEFGETPPTLLSNPGIVRPFENLVKMYGLPSYYEIDPTCIMFVTFPFIFGMMYGDVGHGIVLFLLSVTIFLSGRSDLKRLSEIRTIAPILMICSIFSIIFGFLYGEFFGLRFPPLWLSPSENISYFILLSIWAGVLHLVLGLSIMAINMWKNKKYLRAIFQIQWIIFSGSSIMFFTRMDIKHIDIISFLVLILLPVLMMIAGGILINDIEGKGKFSGATVPFYLGLKYAMHLMSYMRLVIMALAHSTISATIIAIGGKSLISLMVSAFITFILIIIVETFVVFIQTLRLHWVEWFYLFYKGKGKEFSPFKL